MLSPRINEVSGVDHPAHLIEGWIAMQKARGGELSPEMTELLDRVSKSTDPTKGQEMPTDTDTLDELDGAAFEKAISGLPDEVRKGLIANQRRAIQAETLAKSLLDEREDQRFEDMAKELLHLPGVDSASDEQTFAKSLRAVSEGVEPETFDGLFKVLKAADAALATSPLFKEFGASGGSAAGSAGSSIEAIAKELRAADPELSEAESIAKAATENPELYVTHRHESLRQNQEV